MGEDVPHPPKKKLPTKSTAYFSLLLRLTPPSVRVWKQISSSCCPPPHPNRWSWGVCFFWCGCACCVELSRLWNCDRLLEQIYGVSHKQPEEGEGRRARLCFPPPAGIPIRTLQKTKKRGGGSFGFHIVFFNQEKCFTQVFFSKTIKQFQ